MDEEKLDLIFTESFHKKNKEERRPVLETQGRHLCAV